jgi:arginine/lysine/ornithine decarboxylase
MCPPAVSVLVPGERISKEAVGVMLYYGIKSVRVMKE